MSLQSRVAFMVALLVVVLSVVFTWQWVSREEAALERAVDTTVSALGDSLFEEFTEALETGGIDAVQGFQARVEEIPDVESLDIVPLSPAALALASSEGLDSLDPITSDTFESVTNGGVTTLMVPLTVDGEAVARVDVTFRDGLVSEPAAAARRSGVTNGLGVLLLGLVATMFVARSASSGVRTLTAEVRDYAERHLPEVLSTVRDGRPVTPAQLEAGQFEVRGVREVEALSSAFSSHRAAVAELAGELSARLIRSDTRFRVGFETSPIGMALVGPDRTVQRTNAALAALLGRDKADLESRNLLDLLHPDDVLRVDGVVEQLTSGATHSDLSEVRYQTASGEAVWTAQGASVIVDDDGSPLTVFLQVQDVSETKRAQESLQDLAFHDALTGLPNRVALEQTLHDALAHGRPALAMLDLDRFKLVNDSLGHHAGDQLLREVAERLSACVGPDGTLARLGGDEFVAILPTVDADVDAELAAERLLAGLDAPFELEGRRFWVRGSIGLALAEPGQSANDLLANADAAVYSAKQRGRGRWVRFDQSLQDDATERLALEHDLRDAIGTDQLLLHYQPIVDARTGRLIGLEGLARWVHPTRGPVSPGAFIPVAEETGLIGELGDQVLDMGLADLARWSSSRPDRNDFRLSLNLSGRQLHDRDLVRRVGQLLATHGVDPGRLVLEVTETTLLDDDAVGQIERLRRLGLQIAADDFGSGFTAIGRLARQPVDLLKVDMSLVRDAAVGGKAAAILASVGSLGRALGVHVVAEGVEEPAQYDAAVAAGCDLIQGYLFGRPVSAEEVADVVLPARDLLTEALRERLAPTREPVAPTGERIS